jgi:hypothetical protein
MSLARKKVQLKMQNYPETERNSIEWQITEPNAKSEDLIPITT